MKTFLLPQHGNFYKANLHCHTTVSDGLLSPEEVKKAYMDRGYSIVAYTDHNVFIDRSDLTEAGFLALNGYELDISPEENDSELNYIKTCHVCYIALDPNNLFTDFYHRTKYYTGNEATYRDRIIYDHNAPDVERIYTPQFISYLMETGREKGFFVTYNHPTWSMETVNEYTNYHSMHAMEICNYSSAVAGYDEYNEHEYDDMLRHGERIFCIATDDNHNFHPLESPHCDSFGAFTVIKADSLEYKTITNALVNGNFYASCGPEIRELWFEDGFIHINCSDARCIRMATGRRRSCAEYGKDGNAVNSASFKVEYEDAYVRLTVVDKAGKCAYTNAYFTDKLFNGAYK